MSKGLSKTKLDLTVVKFTTQVTKILLYVLLLTVVLSMVGIPATSIITVIGTAGVAIGLALQNSLSNVAGGFLLMLTKPFKIGDYIITNGVEGTVSQISILHTRLDSFTNQAIFIPNGLAVNATIINNSGNDFRRVDLLFSISYDEDFEKAQSVIREVINAHKLVDRTKPIDVRMSKHGESAIEITVTTSDAIGSTSQTADDNCPICTPSVPGQLLPPHTPPWGHLNYKPFNYEYQLKPI